MSKRAELLHDIVKTDLSILRETKRLIADYMKGVNKGSFTVDEVREITVLSHDIFVFFIKIRKSTVNQPCFTEELLTFEKNFTAYMRRAAKKLVKNSEDIESGRWRKKALLNEARKINNDLLNHTLSLRGIFDEE